MHRFRHRCRRDQTQLSPGAHAVTRLTAVESDTPGAGPVLASRSSSRLRRTSAATICSTAARPTRERLFASRTARFAPFEANFVRRRPAAGEERRRRRRRRRRCRGRGTALGLPKRSVTDRAWSRSVVGRGGRRSNTVAELGSRSAGRVGKLVEQRLPELILPSGSDWFAREVVILVKHGEGSSKTSAFYPRVRLMLELLLQCLPATSLM